MTPFGSNPRPLGLESSTLPLSHCTPYLVALVEKTEVGASGGGGVVEIWC